MTIKSGIAALVCLYLLGGDDCPRSAERAIYTWIAGSKSWLAAGPRVHFEPLGSSPSVFDWVDLAAGT
jgi:hypothetical protein